MTFGKYVIWDFNGTIIDDVDISFKAANKLLEEYGLERIPSIDSYRGMLCFPVIDYYRKLGFDFEKFDFSIPADRWVDIYMSLQSEVSSRNDTVSAVKELKNRGYFQSILSASDRGMLTSQLVDLGINDLFDEIYCKDDVYAYGKLDVAARWRNDHPNVKAVFIGDMAHDHESAEIIGCPCVLISGGHSLISQLESCNGAVVVSDTSKLLDIITGILEG